MDPWELELFVVRDGSHDSGERRSLARDVERGLLLRPARGAYVERTAVEAMSEEDRHVVRMRAIAAVSPGPVMFSHFSAAVLHGLPVLRRRLDRVHATVPDAGLRGRDGVAGHVFPLQPSEVVPFGPLLVTSLPRTVVDVAGGAPFAEGVSVADAALHAGTPRLLLEEAAELVGGRQAGRRIANVIAFGHPGAEGANESHSRSNMLRMGLEPPELQHELWDHRGFVAFLDFFFRRFRVGGEADGLTKYLDPKLATRGAARAVVAEKHREDRVLPLLAGLARWGWPESRNHVLLRQKLVASGVHPPRHRATLADYAAAARDARPRQAPRHPQLRS